MYGVGGSLKRPRRPSTGPIGLHSSLLRFLCRSPCFTVTIPADASLFVGEDEDVDQDATAEIFLLVAGLSTIVFGVAFNVPFIVAPSVLYSAREPGYAPKYTAADSDCSRSVQST